MTAVFEVLAEESRRRILDLLAEDERPVGELVDLLALSQPAVSKHLKVLREAGLVRVPHRRPTPYLPGQSRAPAGGRRMARPVPPAVGGSSQRAGTSSRDHGGERGGVVVMSRRRGVRHPRAASVTSPILRYERRLAHPRERVWRAITEDADLAAWFPTTIEGAAARRRPAPLLVPATARRTPFDGEMLAFVPPSLMELRWADDVLRFELEADADPERRARSGLHPAPRR